MTTIKSIEEKARRYDKALERANKLKETCDSNAVVGWMEYIFPELKESGDIRKRIIDALHGDVLEMGEIKKAIAWLEKQGNLMKALQISNAKIGELIEKNYYLKEQLEKQGNNMGISEVTKQELEDNLNKALKKETPESCNEFLDEQGEQKSTIEMKTPEESLGIDSDTYNKIVDECIYGEQKPIKEHNACEFCEDRYGCVNPCSMKLIEKEKPVDKIELKFKVGDWIIFNEHHNSVYQVEKIQGLRYYLRHYTGGSMSVHIDNQLIRHWTIQDAKAGDVLAVTMYPEGTWIGILKEYNGCTFSSYCFVNTEGTFKLGTYNHGNGKAIHPATKEQRDQLEKAMTDAGYTFDFEKKELKKVEQKPAWSEEDIELLDNTIKFIEDRVAATSPSLRTYSPTLTGKEIPFLKALKDRVQPKQEWSEDTQQWIDAIIFDYESWYDADKDHRTTIQAKINILKSFKERYAWKPSESDILLLERIANGKSDPQNFQASLCGLIGQLKKLREG